MLIVFTWYLGFLWIFKCTGNIIVLVLSYFYEGHKLIRFLIIEQVTLVTCKQGLIDLFMKINSTLVVKGNNN